MTIQSAWSETRVKAMLAAYSFRYQNVELPYGLQTGGNDRSPTANSIFPADMTGKSVFDLGCMHGYFLFEAERRGATRIFGGDINPENVAKCKMLADCKGSRAEFAKFDIERDAIPGKFDYVLCLNVLHHLRNPLAALEKLIDATKECLVLEVAAFNKKARNESWVPYWFGGLLNRLPIFYVGGASRDAKGSRGFFMTESAIVALLNHHRRDFARVKIVHVGGQKGLGKGRFIAIAPKRRIEHLHIFAGTNTIGKSTLLESFRRGENPLVAEKLGLGPVADWRHQMYNKLPQAPEAEMPHMLLEYNIGKYLFDGPLHHYERGVLDLIKVAEKVTITTFWLRPEILHERYMTQRVPESWLKRRLRSSRRRRMERKLGALYADPARFEAMYRDWFAFARRHAAVNHVILQENGYRVVSIEDWERGERG